MKKTLAKRLVLRAQTVKVLTSAQYGQIAGGVPTSTQNTDASLCTTGPSFHCGPDQTAEP